MDSSTPVPAVRVSDAEREAVVARLNAATGEGRLTLAEFTERSGLAYLPEGEGLNVIFVAPQSPAAAGGWRKGDIITAIDGTPVAHLAAIDDWKRDPARQSARLTLAGGETRVLRLSDYY